ncbi:50S ribosomal protein L19 [Porphyromonas gingivicanis]|uniref:Large ribosomal subunit protein bL19 n=1 Tax=Porphyromonas gingivicanis TaxID=266762 RepID=A0A0A2G9R3_9PORP|nr:50S ribosomal protein L19 [Porphyromonas gingivicanis]KGN99172.1 50S ribosomal protein L19 [Porphyromonas gingivicanis]
MDFIKLVHEEFKSGKEHPKFTVGDTITIDYRISEGGKERIQKYRGTVIAFRGHGDKRRFTVRKISGEVGVERIFPYDSPFIETITVEKHGKVRRAKLYYLRGRMGRAARIRERRNISKSVK